MSAAVDAVKELRRERRRWQSLRSAAKKTKVTGMVIKCDGAIEAIDAVLKRMEPRDPVQ